MAAADDLQALADAARAGAHRLLRALSLLGPKLPEGAAATAWQAEADRLAETISHLVALAQNLSAEAVTDALAHYPAEAARLRALSDEARTRIEGIAKVSDALTTIARLLDVGTAVLALAAAPSTGSVEGLADSIFALSDQLKQPDAAG